MAYTTENIKAIADKQVDARPNKKMSADNISNFKWWLAQTDEDLCQQLLMTTQYLARTNVHRINQASYFSRLFSGKPLSNNYALASSKLDASNQLPIGRPTANVCYSCTDTLVSRITQDRPQPVFLTDGGHYKERKLAKEANQFIQGELYRLKAYSLGAGQLKDACEFGDGFLKVYPDFKSGKVCAERTITTELLVDFNDGYYRNPRELIQRKLIDRSVAMAYFPKKEAVIMGASRGDVDNSPRSTETVADQMIIAEGWHLPSGPGEKDGRHVIVCSNGVIEDQKGWDKERFPFTHLQYNENPVGYFAQGLIEILMPSQMEIYRMLIIASQAIELMGVPRVYIDKSMKILQTSFNNRIGTIIEGQGPNPPQFLNAISNPPEIYQWIKWLIENAYQMSGISAMSASSQKPAGLNSGEAIRSYNDLQTDRFAALARRYQDAYTDLSYLIIDAAKEIVDKNGKYSTVYPGKDGLREVDFKHIAALDDNFVIQCFEQSSLPKDPAGRQAKLSEMLAAGEITNQEFRRLSNLPDLEQSDQLAAALEERILHSLDHIIDHGKKDWHEIAPDEFMLDPSNLARTLCVNYINRYSTLHLEEEKMQALRDWFTQVQALEQQANPPPPPVQAAPAPGGVPVAPPAASVSPTSNVQV